MMLHFLSRRDALRGASLLAAGVAAPTWAYSQDNDEPDLQGLAEDAAIWGLPLVQTGRYLALGRAKGLRMNRFYLNQSLATPSLRIPATNVDTLYGLAWLDLSRGPVVLDVPDAATRSYAIQFM